MLWPSQTLSTRIQWSVAIHAPPQPWTGKRLDNHYRRSRWATPTLRQSPLRCTGSGVPLSSQCSAIRYSADHKDRHHSTRAWQASWRIWSGASIINDCFPGGHLVGTRWPRRYLRQDIFLGSEDMITWHIAMCTNSMCSCSQQPAQANEIALIWAHLVVVKVGSVTLGKSLVPKGRPSGPIAETSSSFSSSCFSCTGGSSDNSHNGSNGRNNYSKQTEVTPGGC